MTKFLDFTKDEQRKFMEDVKSNVNVSWEKVANLIGVSRSSIFSYKNGKTRLSYNKFLKFCEFAGIDPKNYNIKFFKRSKIKINFPEVTTNNLAEFLGILAGDGHMNSITYEVSITGHKNDDLDYIKKHVSKVFNKSFGLKPKIRFQKNVVRCWVYSKDLVISISSKYNIPVGKKKGKLQIPKEIIKNKEHLRFFIRGLFDTDGSVYQHHGNDYMIEISSKYPKFRKDIIKAFKLFGFCPSEGVKNVRLYRMEETKKFFDLFKPQNKKHLKRFKELQNKRLWSSLAKTRT